MTLCLFDEERETDANGGVCVCLWHMERINAFLLSRVESVCGVKECNNKKRNQNLWKRLCRRFI